MRDVQDFTKHGWEPEEGLKASRGFSQETQKPAATRKSKLMPDIQALADKV